MKDSVKEMLKKSLSGLVRCKENDSGELEVYDCLSNGKEYSFLHETPGWRMWYADGYQTYRQTFDSVREFARAA